MLDPAAYARAAAAFDQVIDTLGTEAVWRQILPPNTQLAMRVGIRLVGREDAEVVNAVGIGGRIITARAAGFAGDQPEKFDTFTIGGKVFVADTVREVFLNDTLLGWKILARAQN